MRTTIARLGAATALLVAAAAAPEPAGAADLDRHLDGKVHRPFPEYFGRTDPWSARDERPPRKGLWFHTQPNPPGVNFLVPLGKRGAYARPEPWTPAWFRYCAERWPSFDPDTGTIVTPDGRRMCI